MSPERAAESAQGQPSLSAATLGSCTASPTSKPTALLTHQAHQQRLHGTSPRTSCSQTTPSPRNPRTRRLIKCHSGLATFCGVPLGNQSVLLRGVNDNADVMKSLMHKLLMRCVRPYYLYQCDLIQGSSHLRTSVADGIDIIEQLRSHTTGYAVPQFVIDAPGGGKVPPQSRLRPRARRTTRRHPQLRRQDL